MTIDVSQFHLCNVSDTCSVWNVLSSKLLYQCALRVGVSFVCPEFVVYECLIKPRRSKPNSSGELVARLRNAQSSGQFQVCKLDIGDLQSIEILEQRRRLGKGELSAIALAQKIGQTCLTDDQGARRLANEVLGPRRTQTTPHMLGWLVYKMHLLDGDVDQVISEHGAMDRPLASYFKEAYQEACRCRLMAHQGTSSAE